MIYEEVGISDMMSHLRHAMVRAGAFSGFPAMHLSWFHLGSQGLEFLTIFHCRTLEVALGINHPLYCRTLFLECHFSLTWQALPLDSNDVSIGTYFGC